MKREKHPSVALEEKFAARNYDPYPVVMVRGERATLFDDAGKRYLDMLGAYSAVSFGHGHPRLLAALEKQARTLAVTSRAVHTEPLGPMLARLCEMTGMDRALPMNTGAEGVETALKAARKWGEFAKGIPEGKVEILGCKGNFHGRTTGAIALSTVPQYRRGFGPFAAGMRTVEFGDLDALRDAITENTAAFLVEPIQGEAGIVVPPHGYLHHAARICRDANVLVICDEVQTGLGRTGAFCAFMHEAIRPDGLILGKALGGGLLPVSAFLAKESLMHVFTPGDHGSTFGGNALAAAVAMEALAVLEEEKLVERSAVLGARLVRGLVALASPHVREVRGRGLFVGLELVPEVDAHAVALHLLDHGVLTKDTHRNTLRFAPPFVISEAEIDEAIQIVGEVLAAERVAA